MREFFEVFFKSFWIVLFVVLLWVIHFSNIYFDLNLVELGVMPRSFKGLIGVLLSPLIHSKENINHLMNNSVPFLILCWTLFYFYKPIAWKIFTSSWILTGLFVWISAREAYHIGISGVLYSLLFFIFFSGVFRKEARLLTVALLVVFLYGSMVWGIFPYDWTISFESHFFGLFPVFSHADFCFHDHFFTSFYFLHANIFFSWVFLWSFCIVCTGFHSGSDQDATCFAKVPFWCALISVSANISSIQGYSRMRSRGVIIIFGSRE